jgi:hypothetical protein
MKFKKYLIENKVPTLVHEDIMTTKEWETFCKACKPFFMELKKTGVTNKAFYRGVKSNFQKWTIRNSYLYNRNPKNTNPEIHDLLNKTFEKKFGWKVRNGVFVTTSKIDAGYYGKPCFFIPEGDFSFVWSKSIKDMITFVQDLEVMDKKRIAQEIEEIVSEYQNNGLKEALNNDSEVSFRCERYYLFDSDYIYWEDLIEALKWLD